MCLIFSQQRDVYKAGDIVPVIRVKTGINIECDYDTLKFIYDNLKSQYRLSVCQRNNYYRCYFGDILDYTIQNNIGDFIKENM